MRIFDNITRRFQLRFKDRESAGNILGEALKDSIKKEHRKNCVVLGIPRGGVITGYCIAKKLGSQFGLIIPRKLCAPDNEEIAIGAVTGDGTTYLNHLLIKELGIPSDYIAGEKLKQLKEIERRTSLYIFKKKTITGLDHTKLHNKTIIVADDGIASGATIIAAERSIKSSGSGSKIIIATPVAPKSTVSLLKNEEIDHIELIISPGNSEFKSVEQYYHDFHQVTDQEVIEIITRSMIEE
ncbi:MAG TPA: phosphoribosyltransferase family protein [Nitrososphaeraceae archaeon]|jgi:predicted phosphoribosyltransferase